MKAVHIVPTCRETVTIEYQDQCLLVVSKPAGLLSVPGRHPDNRDCVISRIQQDYPSARIVHRLDLDTSGLMVIALDEGIHRQLSALFEKRAVNKQYTAIVSGLLDHDSGCIDLPLMRDWPNRPRQKVDIELGKKAITNFQLIDKNNENAQSRVLLSPVTGRTHQLRVHMAAVGHPILGCGFYAPPTVRDAAERLLLHASLLSFSHPLSGEKVSFTKAPPF